jgi:excinuclease ABC subunit C
MNVITNFQDEVHNVAIEYHRKVREKRITKSSLDDIKGIGEKKKIALLKKFGSVEKIKQASIEEIAKVPGINEELARKIKES